jgi:hypothetical protein
MAGFSHIATTLETAAVMGWFVVLILGEKYMDDATRARRSAESSAEQSASVSAMGFCQGGAPINVNRGAVAVHPSLKVTITGMPDVATLALTLIQAVGAGSLKPLALYTKSLQTSEASATAETVKAAAPLGYTSGVFRGHRSVACLERSLDSPGAPWANLGKAASDIFNQNIKGY